MTDASSAMPNSIKILGLPYSVREEKGELNQNTLGLHRRWQCEIILAGEQAEQGKKHTIIHEALHGISTVLGTNLSEENVCSLSTGIFALMRDNPALVAWIMAPE